MRGGQNVNFSNISATPAAFELKGGLYQVDVIGTGFGTVTLQRLGPDGSTPLTAMAAFAANGTAQAYLPPGQYTLAIATTTAVYANITRIPFE